MGNCSQEVRQSSQSGDMCLRDFHVEELIGRGSYGEVFRAKMKETGEKFAIKKMSKARVLARNSLDFILNERKLLTLLSNEYDLE